MKDEKKVNEGTKEEKVLENKEVEVVCLHDVIASKEYRDSVSKLTFAIGKDIAGKNIANPESMIEAIKTCFV